MRKVRANVERAAALHRDADLIVTAAEQALHRRAAEPAAAGDCGEQHEIVAALRAAAAQLAPGWLGDPLDAPSQIASLPAPGRPLAGTSPAAYIRIGTAQPLDDAGFPAIVPLAQHLTIDGDARDARVAGLLRSLILRLVAAHPAGTIRITTVDATGAAFGAFDDLVAVGVMSAPVADRDGLCGVLTEVEEWVRDPGRRHSLVLMIASFPRLTDEAEFVRIAQLAEVGFSRGLHLIIAGWPPPPLAAVPQFTAPPPLAAHSQFAAPLPRPRADGPVARGALPHATALKLGSTWAVLGNPPGTWFGSLGSLNSPVSLDPDPPAATIRYVCQRIAQQVGAGRSTLTDLLPEQPWQESSADGLAAVVGYAGGNPLTLRLSDLTPHWLICGRAGAGTTAFLINVLYGLSTRYGADQISLYLLDFKEGVSFTEFVPTPGDPTWIPQARAVGIGCDREYGLAVLRDLESELSVRERRYKEAGVTGFADLRTAEAPPRSPLPRIVCVIDEFPVLLQGGDQLARDAVAALESLARKGRSYGIHLILASQTVRGVESLCTTRESIFGQFPVRVALPGGGNVLDPANQSANPLGQGEAIVNTAGGLGGPPGASRAHERLIRFPDPHAEPGVLAMVRRGLWEMRGDDGGQSDGGQSDGGQSDGGQSDGGRS